MLDLAERIHHDRHVRNYWGFSELLKCCEERAESHWQREQRAESREIGVKGIKKKGKEADSKQQRTEQNGQVFAMLW
jgi:hypothetical protein